MTISSVNAAFMGSYGAYNQKLTQETKQKLQSLQIPFDTNITEAEGRKLLSKAQEARNNKEQNSSNQNSSSKNNLFEQACALAKKLGIEANENTSFKTLLNIIENRLRERIEFNKNNMEALRELKTLSSEFSIIQAQATGSQNYNTNEALMKSLEMLGDYNKNFLNK